jgi:hypothetical protein
MVKRLVRRRLLPLYALAVFVTAFTVTSFAQGTEGTPRFRDGLPAVALSQTALDTEQQLAAANAIGEGATNVGISAASFSDVRVIAQTSLGPLILVPGTHGACLVLASSSACGDPGGAAQPLLSLLVSRGVGEPMIGGGIVAAGIHEVTISQGGRSEQVLSAKEGYFEVTAAEALVSREVVDIRPS